MSAPAAQRPASPSDGLVAGQAGGASIGARIGIIVIRVYQVVLSPVLGPACRYQPSCSTFAVEALSRHGLLRGGWLALRRLSRCHPLGGHGYDPVP